MPTEPANPIVPTEPPLDAPPRSVTAAGPTAVPTAVPTGGPTQTDPVEAAPPVDVAMVKVEMAPLPERPAGESGDAPRD